MLTGVSLQLLEGFYTGSVGELQLGAAKRKLRLLSSSKASQVSSTIV